MKPRQTLEAARARLAAAEAAYSAAATPEVLAGIAFAEAAHAEEDRASERAGVETHKAHKAAEGRLRLKHVSPHDGTWTWHPDLLADFERVVGVHYDARNSVQPGNTNRDVYGAALVAYASRLLRADPECQAASAAAGAAAVRANEAWSRKRDASRVLDGLFLAVEACRREVAALDAAAAATPPEDAAAEKARRAEERKAEALAKRAREVLAKIAAGTLDPREEVSRG